MKKLKTLLFLLMATLFVFALAACDDGGKSGGNGDTDGGAVVGGNGDTDGDTGTDPSPEAQTITGVTFESVTLTYDGQEHVITVTGALPAGVTASYTGNRGTDAGTYSATATLSGEGYATLTLHATLTIEGMEITGVTFSDQRVTYDGTEHVVTVTDPLPAGVTASYTGNRGTDAGTYNATATLSGKNYKTKTLTATLTVDKATITGVTLDNKTVTYKEGTSYSLSLTGEVPDGVEVAWTNNGQTEPGSYEVTATLTGKNYKTLSLTAVLRILPDLSTLASTVMEAFGSVPDVWEFLPENFRLNEAHAYRGAKTMDFSAAQNVTAIPTTGIGKQLDVVYGTVVKMQTLLGYVDKVYASANTIAGLYQSFINSNPDNYREFSGSTDGGGMQFRILLEEEQYTLLVKMGSVAVEMYADANEEHYTGRVQITDTNALKFEVRENSLKIALEIIGTAMTQLEFVRNDDAVVGYLYECLDTEVADHALTFSTSALLTWSGDYVTVSGTNGDFIPGFEGSLVEVYDADTGKFVGSEVKETKTLLGISVEFNTYWFPLADFSGVNTVRAVKKEGAIDSDLNPHTIYVNGAAFAAKTVGGLSKKTASRRYDIEMKKVYLYTYDSATEKYDKIGMEIPMFFVQEEVYGDLESDVKEKNSGLTGFKCNVKTAIVQAISSAYRTQLPAYEEIKDLLTPDMIVGYVGSKNGWFAS